MQKVLTPQNLPFLRSLMFSTFARGKLLLTNEYFVLDGAAALALPVQYGQAFSVRLLEEDNLFWYSYDQDQAVWFAATYSLPSFAIRTCTDAGIAQRLQQMLQACRQLNTSFLATERGVEVITQLDFDRSWGLGTSSTLIAALARWANVDPYYILEQSLGGSGYDLACAYAEGPILYQRKKNSADKWIPTVQASSFSPPFAAQLYFVYLGQKQDSRQGIERYKNIQTDLQPVIEQLDEITHSILQATALPDFEALLRQHEYCISTALDLPTAQSLYFSDYKGVIKSLGAWGGDFVLVTSEASFPDTKAYFEAHNCPVCIPYMSMVYNGRV